ncbi:ribonuclease Ps [Raphanus sativus]|uniref:Ribonucleases P/MRP protein subunit POP1 isoform X1 n=1 Tax=Raphanus sativus TaxID=3726 RepID=A0A6J0MZP1_RAPSA|nr:ribonucleases P/MRP protein subunit POP1 isoform X1 [Raphanus sativus]KAJ4904511.1 ribonuclease Ps [Raphanus sativus]
MASSGNGNNNKKRGGGLSSLAPREISVQKFSEARAAELESLHSIVSERLNKDFRSKRNQRRRTNAYTNQPSKKRNIKRQRSESLLSIGQPSSSQETKIPRRVKRRLELKGNPESGFSTTGDGTKRLRTHVWHAKRFSMTKLWGFHLPLGLHGGGRGSRDILKKSRQGVLVHDASYHIAVQLEGPEGSLLSILNMLLEPSPLSHSKEVFDSILTGLSYGNAMLYHVEPPVSQVIAPVIYMWRPSQLPKRNVEEKVGDCVGNDGPVSNGDHADSRKLWLWIHASSFSEGYASLKLACQKQMDETGVLVDCLSLEGQLAKLEIFGTKASQLLQKTIHPVPSSSENSPSILRKCSMGQAEVKNVVEPYKEESISSCAILPRFVIDPRLIPNNPCDDSTMSLEMTKTKSTESLEMTTSTEAETFKCLWDANCELYPPEEENILCWEKHQSRMKSFCIDDPADEFPKISSRPRSSRSCPLLLLKHKQLGDTATGWSLILPLSWVKVFWNTFVSKGAQAIGQREKRWVSCDAGLPFFPSDFPDCKAYSSLKMSEAADLEEKAQRRPLAVRPSRIPIPPPWSSIHVTRCVKESSDQKLTNGETSGVEIFSNVGKLFDGIVARTPHSLPTFLQTFTNRVETIQEDETKARAGILQNSDNKLCLVRVLLHAFKEGSFEEGAVVCAPSLADVSLLKSGCSEGEEERVTIPQSSVSCYFQEQPSGTWELNVPEDTHTKQSHRWPIGFVTTGFVRGSKKPTAEALCDAVLLGRLREEQWKGKDVKRRKKEIYVLVRNLRSCAYRLALATIVLEQQDASGDDVHCF